MSSTLHLTLSEYDQMVACGAFDAIHRKVELIRGEICEMNPAGPIHDDLLAYLLDWSFKSIGGKSIGGSTIQVRGQSGMSLPSLNSRPEPDLFWVKAKRYLDAHPTGEDTLLAIEVADSSLKSDRSTKADLYAEAGIPEYWVVDVQSKSLHIMREADTHGHYGWQRTANIGEVVSPLAWPNAVLNIADLFGELQ